MPTPRDDAAAGVVNGRLYVIGGYNSTSGRLDTCEEYDPSTDTWTSRTSMPAVRAGAAAGVVNGRIYVIGGYNGTDHLTTCEEYMPTKGYFVYTKD
jgi:N-acetylneuraminic acid mutarotase